MYSYDRRAALRRTPAENVAINLLVDDPDATLPEMLRMVREAGDDLYDQVTGTMVPPRDVEEALRRLVPPPLHGGDIRVYHATSESVASQLLRRGFIPETKPRPRAGFDYAPGRGVDEGLYVGESPAAVSSYGRVILEIDVPRRLLEVPTELAQLGESDPMRALRSHDGAVINTRLPPDAFRRHIA